MRDRVTWPASSCSRSLHVVAASDATPREALTAATLALVAGAARGPRWPASHGVRRSARRVGQSATRRRSPAERRPGREISGARPDTLDPARRARGRGRSLPLARRRHARPRCQRRRRGALLDVVLRAEPPAPDEPRRDRQGAAGQAARRFPSRSSRARTRASRHESFQVVDAKGRKYMLKVDPEQSLRHLHGRGGDGRLLRFFHAAGYYVPGAFHTRLRRRRPEARSQGRRSKLATACRRAP